MFNLYRRTIVGTARLARQRFATAPAGAPPGAVGSFRSLFIQTVETPNAAALKFLPLMAILGENETKEYLSGREAAGLPLALRLFGVDGVRLVMFGSNFITVEKQSPLPWAVLKPEIFLILTEFLTSGQPVLDAAHRAAITSDMAISDDDDEVVLAIKELIFTRIRPAIQDDGGDLEYVDFTEDGTVLLRLKGACRSCDSLAVTLKNGIESMLKHYIEEVVEVRQVDDDHVIDAPGAADANADANANAMTLTPAARTEPPNL
jgi:Fe-S cluster biogenesis protein NfuA